ncbi:hypothetical protein BGZ54_008351 [Gamsiella multidivaricata]|nr:hypothetical protein BGZ54_008351 [Gamsiella multidivaricata]
MASYSSSLSSISAAISDPSSVSISISSSSPTPSASLLPALHLPSSSSDERLDGPNSIVAHASVTESAANLNLDRGLIGGRASHASEHRAGGDAGRRAHAQARGDDNRSDEVDDRIHFRLLNNIFFSTSARQLQHNDDRGTSSASLSHNRELLQRTIDNEDQRMLESGENRMDYGTTGADNTMYTGHGDEFASLMLRARAGQELIEEEDDEDDEDDGIDQIIESRRQRDSEAYPMDIEPPSPLSPSNVERPQHAALSPHAAAALVDMFSASRSAEQQLVIDSSTPSNLQGSQHEYDNNPYFRRPALLDSSEANSSRPQDSVHENQFRSGEAGSDSMTRLRSISTQYETIHREYNSHGGCGERASVVCTETQGDVWPLNFDMYYADGGEFNAAHSVENVLKNDSSVYCSRRSTNINICLKLSEPHQTFVLTQFKVKAPTTGFTAPCKEGLIFISHEPIPLENTVLFDNMTREHYEDYMEGLSQGAAFNQLLRIHGASADALVPAAFFQMNGLDETCTVDLTPNRSGRYILIKLLRSRCTNALQRPENIDLQYLGLIGFTGARSFASGGLL